MRASDEQLVQMANLAENGDDLLRLFRLMLRRNYMLTLAAGDGVNNSHHVVIAYETHRVQAGGDYRRYKKVTTPRLIGIYKSRADAKKAAKYPTFLGRRNHGLQARVEVESWIDLTHEEQAWVLEEKSKLGKKRDTYWQGSPITRFSRWAIDRLQFTLEHARVTGDTPIHELRSHIRNDFGLIAFKDWLAYENAQSERFNKRDGPLVIRFAWWLILEQVRGRSLFTYDDGLELLWNEWKEEHR